MRAPYTNTDPDYPMLYKEDINARMWCVQHHGNGHYFDTVEEAASYLLERFGGQWPSLRVKPRTYEDNAPVVDMAQEIVRCKDCARYEPSTVDEDGEGDPSWCWKWEHEWVAEDGFCAWGERRDA